ncbi:aKG-HExxH-type peptide beta-hydroxylase [Streptacidiphilus sp. PAMC 29251]
MPAAAVRRGRRDRRGARTDGLDGLARLLAPFLPAVPEAARPVTRLPAARPPAVRLDHAGLRLDLWIDDCGPYREVHGEPLAGPLGPAQLRSWREALADAWELLVQRHRWHAEALTAGLTTLVPLLPRPDGTAVSSAARRAFGAVALSLPATPVLLALTLVHEFLHAQLGALLDLVALHGPDSGARYHAPWRPDARPAGALLQGAYAHLGVADFWRVECAGQAPGPATGQARREYARWRTSTLAAAGTLLSSGELTSAGAEFVDELSRTMSAW